jgi:hypothetical protein
MRLDPCESGRHGASMPVGLNSWRRCDALVGDLFVAVYAVRVDPHEDVDGVTGAVAIVVGGTPALSQRVGQTTAQDVRGYVGVEDN